MADFMFNNDRTPMWVGSNTKYSLQNKTTQKTWYRPQINQSPRSTSVIAETMRSSTITSEGQKENIFRDVISCYSKVSNQIQPEEKPIFNKIFISFGYFHQKMAFFSALGKILKNQVVLIFWMNVKFWQKGQLICF